MNAAVERWAVWAIALLGPLGLTAVLARIGGSQKRDYIFGYLALVAVVGVRRGFGPAVVSAAISFLLVDFFFVPPYYTLTIADEQDLVNLAAFAVTAAVVGLLASRHRTALVEAEALAAQLRAANAELVRLNKEQAQAAQAALRLARSEQEIRALKETERMRRELFANVSHELRTPLGTILSESTDTTRASSLKEARDRLDTIAGESRRLNALVTDMLDMARIEGGALELDLEPILLGDAIAVAIDRLRMSSPKRRVTWDTDGVAGTEVLADWDRLGQVFDNLLANADRFSPPEAPIEVSVAREHQGLVTIWVADHGPGVDPDVKPHLFERFVHGRAPGGTGLGLAIVKGLVEAHAGTVALEETGEGTGGGGGAVFRFTLPVPHDS
jgi:K+-sensing histidine kinase KdpD